MIKKIKTPKPKPVMIKRYRVNIGDQHQDFSSQKAAREHLKELCDAPLYFMKLEEVEVERGW